MKRIILFGFLVFVVGALPAQTLTKYIGGTDWKAHSQTTIPLNPDWCTNENYEPAFSGPWAGKCSAAVDLNLASDFGFTPNASGGYSTNPEYIWGGQIAGEAYFKLILNIDNEDKKKYVLRYAFGSMGSPYTSTSRVYVNSSSARKTSSNQDNTNELNITPFLKCGKNVILVSVKNDGSCLNHYYVGDILTNDVPEPNIEASYTYDCEFDLFTLNTNADNHQGITNGRITGPNGFLSGTGNGIIIDGAQYGPGQYTITYNFAPCYSETKTITLERGPDAERTTESITLYACDDGCYWYIPPHEGEFDYYHLTGISGPNNDEYDYNTIDGYENSDGHLHVGWAAHCLHIGGSYLIEFYNLDDHGNPTCLRKTLTVTVKDGSVECAPGPTYNICPGSCQTIGFEFGLSENYKWLDAPFIDPRNRSVCPTESTVYQLEYTSSTGCTCISNFTVIVINEVLPPLQDKEICLGEKYCTEFGPIAESLVEETISMTYDFGDGTYYFFDESGIAPSSLELCHTYTKPGIYDVTVIYETPCGPVIASCNVTVKDWEIIKCYHELNYGELEEFIDLNENILAYVGECCPELATNGVWYDSKGEIIRNPFKVSKTELLNGGVTKEYIQDSKNCIKCQFNLTVYNSEFKKPNENEGFLNRNSIEQQDNLKFALAPNPTANYFKVINFNHIEIYDQIKIMSIDGKVIYADNNVNAAKFHDLSDNTSGIYFIEIKSGKDINRLRLVLQN